MGFQRAARPDEGHIFIGPLERRVLRPSDGTALWASPFSFRETEQASAHPALRSSVARVERDAEQGHQRQPGDRSAPH
jgi:hypothetical protein